jgi:carbamate kinase
MTFSTGNSTGKPLVVVALGGNAISPAAGSMSYRVERESIDRTCRELNDLSERGYRLLIVHGNGPQVGRLMRNDLEGDCLDICVAQTQGELGYLIAEGLQHLCGCACVSITTRTIVDAQDPAINFPDKAVGPVLAQKPSGPSRRSADGWRVLVSSPIPQKVVELDAIRLLLGENHVIAGGGGGIAIASHGKPVQGVVDKDRVAANLAITLDAAHLIFVTDVAGVYNHYQQTDEVLIEELKSEDVQALLAADVLGEGSMAPKVESALEYTSACRRAAQIVGLGSISAGMEHRSGTSVVPS